jgi:transcriptional regulator with XRE-family HTH domain
MTVRDGTSNSEAAASSLPNDLMKSGRVTKHSLHVSCSDARGGQHETLNDPTSGASILELVFKKLGTISARITELRADKGWKLREASDATGGLLSPSRISNYEQGLREMGIPEAKILAKAYGTTAAHVLCLDDDNPVLSKAEQDLIKNLRALPENERHGYMRRIAAVALAYKEPVADERIPDTFTNTRSPTPTQHRKTSRK